MKKIMIIVSCISVLMISLYLFFFFYYKNQNTLKIKTEPIESPIIEVKKEKIQILKYEDFEKILNGDSISFAVFGQTYCQHCQNYESTLNEVIEKNTIDIYYVNFTNLSDEESSKFFNSNLIIPGKCNSTGEDINISDGFGTPLSLFVSSGKIVDCVSGNVTYDTLNNYFKTYNLN